VDFASVILGKIGASEHRELCWENSVHFLTLMRKIGRNGGICKLENNEKIFNGSFTVFRLA